ncbi:hypothetical protein PHYBOEH_008871 [Phytophthora boehmeriae]|uniref:Uncharacterized protein n=1 Tax=Phytophthora boehmeriae TaxID=109152 RepID=A0A8T1W181_9STRA|nr:hypothetical protein PHYBOEH_008871 [Phytophthora boehmeriae]
MAIEADNRDSNRELDKKSKISSTYPETKDLSPDEMKARRRERWRVDQANHRTRKREKELQHLRKVKRVLKLRKSFMMVQDPNMSFEEWKKTRRREQGRIYQINYWKRKRLLEENLMGEIDEIKQQIEQLQMQQSTHGTHKRRIELVETFHRSLPAGDKPQQLPDIINYVLTYGCTPALQILSDLQREEFDSMESLKLHWLWYRSQFREFSLSTILYEYLEAGEHAIVKATGDLLLGIVSKDNEQGGKSSIIVCPVLQQFEFDNGNQVVRRITSEVDFVAGVTNTKGLIDPDHIVQMLSSLSQKFEN